MTMGCNLYGHVIIRPDGIDEGGVWIGEDGAIIEIYERNGAVQRSMHAPYSYGEDKRQRLQRARQKLKSGRLSDSARLSLALDAFEDALREVLGWQQMGEFKERVRKLQAARLAKAGDGGRLFAEKLPPNGHSSHVKINGSNHRNGQTRLPARLSRYRQSSVRRIAARGQ